MKESSRNSNSINTYSHMVTPAILDRRNSLEKALNSLNGRQDEYPPPNTFFIRRNSDLFQKYKDKQEYNHLLTKVPNNMKHNYNVLKLKNTDELELSRKRNK